MQSLKRRLSIRKKKDHVPECSRPHQWQEDEKKVQEGSCSFQVRYLGAVEVLESRGMQVCEDAVKALRSQNKGKYQRAVLYVSGDTLRVVDEISKSMIVDQTIEKVSFCAPDRNHEKGFAYICREGSTRRWMCHGFQAVKESEKKSWRKSRGASASKQLYTGERLSHAVGCAFAICLERKQKRDKETGVTVTFNQDRTSFTRTGSFRQASLTERIADPQSAILAEPVPVRKVDNPFAVQRPHATSSMLQRQGSFRGFEKLQQEGNSPFKRSLSLRLSDLPSTLQRQNAVAESPTQALNGAVGGPISEVSPTQEQEDSIAQMCQQLTQGLSALSSDDPFAAVPRSGGLTHQASLPPYQAAHHALPRQHTLPASSAGFVSQPPPPTNPWASPVSSKPAAAPGQDSGWPGAHASMAASSSSSSSGPPATNPFMSHSSPSGYPPHPSGGVTNGVPSGASHVPAGLASAQRPPALMQHGRSRSMDAGELSSNLWHQPQAPARPTLLQMAHQQRSFQQNGGVGATGVGGAMAGPSSSSSSSSASSRPGQSVATTGPGVDPFDVAWAAKATNKSNPFGSKTVSKQFEVQL